MAVAGSAGMRSTNLSMAAFLDTAKAVPALVRDGLRGMPLGRTLGIVVLLKLFSMFAILRAFFFPNILGSRFDTDGERASHVGSQLVERGK